MSEDLVRAEDGSLELALLRQPTHLLIIYCAAYGLVFVLGLVGNVFVVVSVVWNPSMRNITNYFITSLAVADLLIIIFCLPATLMNNILTEWLLGNFLCKMSVWVNGTTSCTSVYTLVAVTGDRYVAICHTMRYNVLEKKRSLYIIVPIWVISALLFSPWFLYFQQIEYAIPNSSVVARICYPVFPSMEVERLLFLFVNFLIAFLIPLVAITVSYTFIFAAIFRHTSIAVDAKAQERETRLKMRVTNMMLTVIVLFAASWLPLYCLFTYIYFGRPDINSPIGQIVGNILRPVFQWLSLANSCINPILYAYFSNKFRRSFQEILVLPFRQRYNRVRNFARHTMKRYSSRSATEAVRCTDAASLESASLLGGPSRLMAARSFNVKLSPSYRGGRSRAPSVDPVALATVGGHRPAGIRASNGSTTSQRRVRINAKSVGVGTGTPASSLSFSPAGSSLMSPRESPRNGTTRPSIRRHIPQHLAAPVLTMRDLDLSGSNCSAMRPSLSVSSVDSAGMPAAYASLRFVQIRDMTTV